MEASPGTAGYLRIDVRTSLSKIDAHAATVAGFLAAHEEVTLDRSDTVESLHVGGGVRATIGVTDSGAQVHVIGLRRDFGRQLLVVTGNRDRDTSRVIWCTAIAVADSIAAKSDASALMLEPTVF